MKTHAASYSILSFDCTPYCKPKVKTKLFTWERNSYAFCLLKNSNFNLQQGKAASLLYSFILSFPAEVFPEHTRPWRDGREKRVHFWRTRSKAGQYRKYGSNMKPWMRGFQLSFFWFTPKCFC